VSASATLADEREHDKRQRPRLGDGAT